MSFPNYYPSQIAVPLPPDEDIRPVIEAVFGAGYEPEATLNVVKMFTGTEDMFPGVIGLVQAIFGAAGVAPRQRAMVILRIAKQLQAPYEWQVNAVMGRNAGLLDHEIAAAAADGPVTGVDDEYVLLCRAVDELSSARTLTDVTLSQLLATYGDVLTRKYILSMAFFTMIGLCLNSNRVPLETTDKIGGNSTPLG